MPNANAHRPRHNALSAQRQRHTGAKTDREQRQHAYEELTRRLRDFGTPTLEGASIPGVQHRDMRQVAVALIVVQPVADDELVVDRESDILHANVNLTA
jgi:hypothetical protein